MKDPQEQYTVFEHMAGDDFITIVTTERGMKQKLTKLSQKNPAQVRLNRPNYDGGVIFQIPQNWLTIKPPIQSKLTEEQRQKAAERLRFYRERQKAQRAAERQKAEQDLSGSAAPGISDPRL